MDHTKPIDMAEVAKLMAKHLDNSARVKELEATVKTYEEQIEQLARREIELEVVEDQLRKELKEEQAKRHEMGKKMREELVEAYLEGIGLIFACGYASSEKRHKAAEEYADKIMKGEGNG